MLVLRPTRRLAAADVFGGTETHSPELRQNSLKVAGCGKFRSDNWPLVPNANRERCLVYEPFDFFPRPVVLAHETVPSSGSVLIASAKCVRVNIRCHSDRRVTKSFRHGHQIDSVREQE